MSLGADILAWVKATNAVADSVNEKLDALIAKINAGQQITPAEIAAIQAESTEQQAQNQAALDKIVAAVGAGGGGGAPVALADGVAGQPYSANVADSFSKAGRFAPFFYLGTNLPEWLAVDSSNGNVTTKPADPSTDPPTPAAVCVAGDFVFTVEMDDASPDTTDESKTFSLHVA